MKAHAWQILVVALAGWLNRQQQDVIEYLQEENRVLREHLKGKRILFSDDQRRRLASKGKSLGRRVLMGIETLVTPETILRWHRQLIAKKYDGSGKRGVGRPRTRETIRDLVVRMARENTTWGYGRIEGALHNLGHTISRSTIARILKEHGLTPKHRKGMSWSTFLKIHWDALAATDFFTVEVLTLRGLVRYHVLFVMKLSTRTVTIAGIVPEPNGEWVAQIARNLTDPFDGFLRTAKYLIHDRGPAFTKQFASILKSGGVKTVKLPPRSPNLNAYAERFVRSIKEECLSQIIPLGEKHLRHAVEEFMLHYHGERNHQGLDNTLIEPEDHVDQTDGQVQCRNRLGGMLRYYHRAA